MPEYLTDYKPECKFCKSNCHIIPMSGEIECTGFVPMTNAEYIAKKSPDSLATLFAVIAYNGTIPKNINFPGIPSEEQQRKWFDWLGKPVIWSNEEKIRQMTSDELSDFLSSIVQEANSDTAYIRLKDGRIQLIDNWDEWLRQPPKL